MTYVCPACHTVMTVVDPPETDNLACPTVGCSKFMLATTPVHCSYVEYLARSHRSSQHPELVDYLLLHGRVTRVAWEASLEEGGPRVLKSIDVDARDRIHLAPSSKGVVIQNVERIDGIGETREREETPA